MKGIGISRGVALSGGTTLTTDLRRGIDREGYVTCAAVLSCILKYNGEASSRLLYRDGGDQNKYIDRANPILFAGSGNHY